jgi:hypothetical protein
MTDQISDDALAGIMDGEDVKPVEVSAPVDSGQVTLDPEREKDAVPPMPAIDQTLSPGNDRADWPEVVIDEQEGKPNFEVVGVNGKTYQIMRGQPTRVPPEVLHVLENAIASRMVQYQDDQGQTAHRMVDYPAVPYRVTNFPKRG